MIVVSWPAGAFQTPPISSVRANHPCDGAAGREVLHRTSEHHVGHPHAREVQSRVLSFDAGVEGVEAVVRSDIAGLVPRRVRVDDVKRPASLAVIRRCLACVVRQDALARHRGDAEQVEEVRLLQRPDAGLAGLGGREEVGDLVPLAVVPIAAERG